MGRSHEAVEVPCLQGDTLPEGVSVPLPLVDSMKRSPIRPVSKKRAAVNRERKKLLEKHKDDPCVVVWDTGCTRRMQTLHEPLLRSRGGNPASEEGTIPVCGHCHRRIHDNPREATQRGWMGSRYE